MNIRHYSDYISVPADYEANMTREAINKAADTWLYFDPHPSYLSFLRTLFDESKSTWLTGNFGTGKSSATLVTHKLFTDDLERVRRWFLKNKDAIPNHEELLRQVEEAREAGILVIYDYNAAGLDANQEFLVRLEKGITDALQERNLSVPPNAGLASVIERLRREGSRFFEQRDEIQSRLLSLDSSVRTVNQLISRLHDETRPREEGEAPTHYLEDVLTVFRHDSIYLDVNVSTFRAWVKQILEVNHLSRIIYLFDEFADFLDENRTLKTFEDVTEAPSVNRFYLVPTTHKQINAFYSENSPGAKKARDRFYFCDLKMPNDTAFRLAHNAMRECEDAELRREWRDVRDNVLWRSVKTVAERFDAPPESEDYVSKESFLNILPIHPMAAFLLKFLSDSAGSNQRSIFEYLKGSANGREFQDFISSGGPDVSGRVFLTVDYLWRYFMERDDLGQQKEISEIRTEYARIHTREFANFPDDNEEIRVLKTVLLFCLLSRLTLGAHERLRPTVENICLSYQGDNAIGNVDGVLHTLRGKHAFSIINGNIELFTTSVSSAELTKKADELFSQFHEILSPKCTEKLEEYTQTARGSFSNGRFDLRVSDVNHVNLTNLSSSVRDKYSADLRKDNGTVCLWFVIAKDQTGQMQIPEKAENLLRQLRGHRIVMISFPYVTFCSDDVNQWREYTNLYAQYLLENSDTAKEQIKKNYEEMENRWFSALRRSGEKLDLRHYDVGQSRTILEHVSLAQLKEFLREYVCSALPCCPDLFPAPITSFTNKGLQSWALAGIRFSGSSAPQTQLIGALRASGISVEPEWFHQNPEHFLTRIHALLMKRYSDTVEKGGEFSMNEVWKEVKRAPYGMRNNGLSAFTLGFCLRSLLEKNCQWTNGQTTEPLDDKTLAEIVEKAVSEKPDKEKRICQLSKELRTFAARAGEMFGLLPDSDMNPVAALNNIGEAVRRLSHRIPLWVLADSLRREAPEDVVSYEVFRDLCTALRTSSKGNQAERSNAMSRIGKAILSDEDLPARLCAVIQPGRFISAFHEYVDWIDAELPALAERIGDVSQQYCDRIVGELADDAGWLWNERDISKTVEKVHTEYRVVEMCRPFLHISGFSNYDSVMRGLTERFRSGGVPYDVIAERYPGLRRVFFLAEKPNTEEDIYQELQNNLSALSALYGDKMREQMTDLTAGLIDGAGIPREDLYAAMQACSAQPSFHLDMTKSDYGKLLQQCIDASHRQIAVRGIQAEWKRITGCLSLQDWAKQVHLPAWTALCGIDQRNQILEAMENPDNLSIQALEASRTSLEALPPVRVQQCQKAFLQAIIPVRYQKLKIHFQPLIAYLREKYGTDPNHWPVSPDIETFVREQYQIEFAPDIVLTLRSRDPGELKEHLISLAGEYPEIGLHFLE